MTFWKPGSRGAALLVLALLCSSLLSSCRGADPGPEQPAPGGGAEARGPDLVIVSYDTVRRDHLSLYGYHRPTSPRLSRLADSSVVFEHAFTTESNTNPAHASLFTGRYPHEHGNQANGHILAAGTSTLAGRLSEAGYRTGGFVSAVPMSARASGLDAGFEHYDDFFEERRRAGAETTRRALAWYRQADPRPTFLFLHLYDAHGPYLPTDEELAVFPRSQGGPSVSRVPSYQQLTDASGRPLDRLGDYVDRYDALLARLDGLLASVLEVVDQENTFVLVVADHGETLGERFHPLDHGAQVFDEQIRIPAVLSGPGLRPQRSMLQIEMVDLAPTIEALLGVPREAPNGVSGIDVSSHLLDPDARVPLRELVFSSARADPYRHGDRGYELVSLRRIFSVRSPEWKLVHYPGKDQDYLELYDLKLDPEEKVNLLIGENAAGRASDRERSGELLAALEQWNPGYREPIRVVDVSDELEEQLRALGYID